MKTAHIFLLLLAIALFFSVAGVVPFLAKVQLSTDNAWTRSDVRRLYERLEKYNKEHGCYPVQQDMKTLFKTLDMKKSDFHKGPFFDIRSAEYHAPIPNQEESIQNSKKPIITMRVKWKFFGKYYLLVVNRDGEIYYEDIDTGAKL